MEISTRKTSRIEVVDSLRGFAILAILLIHHVDHYFFPEFPTNSPHWLNFLDQATVRIIFELFSGKTYAIFTMLFGFTFFIQHNNQKKKGKDFGYRFLWRMILLAVFAFINAAFFPSGDILMLFVCVSPILFICRNWSDKAVLVLIVFIMLQPIEWIHFILSRFNPSHQLPDFGALTLHQQVVENTRNGNFFDFIRINATVGLKVSLLWVLETGRFLQAAGLFLLGFYIGRKQYFVSSSDNFRFWTRVLIISIIFFVIFHIIKKPILRADEITQQTIGLTIDLWQKLVFTFAIVASFVLIYQIDFIRKWISFLRFYGKMSLTNYVTQSFIGAFIYLPVGLYLAPYCGRFYSLLIGLAVFLIQMIFTKLWLSKYNKGPLEEIWHKWTWISFEKKQKNDSVASPKL